MVTEKQKEQVPTKSLFCRTLAWFGNWVFSPLIRGIFSGAGGLLGCVLIRWVLLSRIGIFEYSGTDGEVAKPDDLLSLFTSLSRR
jgi:hypothetical protein